MNRVRHPLGILLGAVAAMTLFGAGMLGAIEAWPALVHTAFSFTDNGRPVWLFGTILTAEILFGGVAMLAVPLYAGWLVHDAVKVLGHEKRKRRRDRRGTPRKEPHFRTFCLALVMAGTFLAQTGSVLAFEREDIRRLEKEKKCVGCDLGGATLSNADLANAVLSRSKLFAAHLREANLANADLSESYLGYANLVRADLSGADLRDADLTGADLTGADLTGANLQGADLTDAIIRRAILCNTTMPDGREENRDC